MEQQSHFSKLWWILPNQLVGMPQPQVDDLSALHNTGVKAIISLLEDEIGLDTYTKNNFKSKWIPIADDSAPTLKQVSDLVEYIDKQLDQNCPVAIHCKGGKGRTGTMLAAYLISKGTSYEDTMNQINEAKPNAIKKEFQINFLKKLSSI